MTFFLEDSTAPPPAPRGPDLQPLTPVEGVGTAFSEAMRSSNANFRLQREKGSATQDLVRQAVGIMGADAARKALVAAGLPDPGETVVTRTDLVWAKDAQEAVLNAARGDAVANGSKWSGLDLSGASIDRQVSTTMQVEAAANEEALSMLPSGRGAAELIGGLGTAFADIRQLPFLIAGGGEGALLKVLAREAGINMATEVATLPGQFEMAKVAGTPDPNVPQQLTVAALGGALFGGVAHALGRALTYAKGRATLPEGRIDPAFHEAAVGAAESALSADANPMAAVTQIMRDAPLKPEPLIPYDAGAQFDAAFKSATGRDVGQTTAPPPPDAITTTVLPPAEGQALDVVRGADSAIKAAESNAAQPAKPKGKAPPTLKDFVAAKRVWLGDPMIADFKALGYKRPGMERKDLLARSSAGDNGGGMKLDDLAGAAHEAGYFKDRPTVSEFLDALNNDIRAKATGGTPVHAMSDMGEALDWRMYREAQGAYDEAVARGEDPSYMSPVEDVQAKTPAPDGLFFSESEINGLVGFTDNPIDVIASQVRHYAAEKGIKLHPAEVQEVADTLIRNGGGDAQFLIERQIERGLNDVEHEFFRKTGEWSPATGEPPFGNAASDAIPAGQPEAARGNAAEGRADGQQSPSYERTSAGQQQVAPGIAPITDRQRLEAQMSAPLKGGQAATDMGLFDMGARQQTDMFSDPGGAKARPAQMAMVQDLQDQVAKGEDITFDLGDGPRTEASLANELEQDASFEEVLNACRGGA